MRAVLRLAPPRRCRPPWRPWNPSGSPRPRLSPGPLILSLLATSLLLCLFVTGVAPGSPVTKRHSSRDVARRERINGPGDNRGRGDPDGFHGRQGGRHLLGGARRRTALIAASV